RSAQKACLVSADLEPKSSPIYKITPDEYMPNNTRINKKNQLLFSSDPASLERSIRKGIRSSSINNNTSSLLDFRQPPSTQTLVSSTDTRSPPSTKDTLPSTDIVHPTSIDTEPQDMVATLILIRDEKGDLHDQEGHLRNAVGSLEHRSMTPTGSTASCNVVRIMTHEEFTARHPHPSIPIYVYIDRHTGPAINRQRMTAIDRQPPAPID
ncbi:hypothetical protein IGI04_029924, partial [Brassica rapa subsp. trilocularis]